MKMIILFAAFSLAVSAHASPTQDPTMVYHAKRTFSDAFDATGLAILGAGMTATLIAFSLDLQMHDAWANHQRMSQDISHVGDYWGIGYVEMAVVAGQLLFDRENGIVDAEGEISAALVTHSAKFITARERPDSSVRTSFPSGHTSASFALATALGGSYGLKAAIPAFSMGVLTGFSRLADNAHWFSDVVAGATVGILFGRAGFKHHFMVTPIVLDDGGRGGGLSITARW